MNKHSTEDLGSSETILYDTTRMDTYHYTFVKTKQCSKPRVNPYVDYRLWVIMMCQGSSSVVTNVALWGNQGC